MDAINFNFLCNNVKGLQTSKKPLKSFNYFKNKILPNGIIFYKKRIPQRRTKLRGKTNLMVIYTFHMVNQICVEY